MENGQATITFDGINLDKCIEQGLELTGQARCRHCKQVYTFQLHLNRKDKPRKYEDAVINGKPVTTRVPDRFEVFLEFSNAGPANPDAVQPQQIVPESEKPEVEPQCVPCSRCTPNCERVYR